MTEGVTFKGLTPAQFDKVRHGHLHYPHKLFEQRCKIFRDKDFYVKPLEVAKLAGLEGVWKLRIDGHKGKSQCMHKAFNGVCTMGGREGCQFCHEDWTDEQAKATLAKAEPGLKKLEAALN